MNQIKVLIVDDSAIVRQSFKSLLESDPEIKVIGTASDPYIAVQKIQKERPDVITLDIEMPKMDGLTFLKKIMVQAPMPVVVISNQTLKGADVALKALEIGAVDVLSKPDLSTEVNREESRITLIDKVRSAFFARSKKNSASDEIAVKEMTSPSSVKVNDIIKSVGFSANVVIAVGASTGGTEAIKSFLEVLPAEMPPIVIVQHMPEKFTASFAKRLNEHCALSVKEASHNEAVMPSTVYIAPGNHHMQIVKAGTKKLIKISQGDLVNRHRPSVNVLFESVAETAGRNAVGVILTGMGDDGATGMLSLHRAGAFTIAQDENTSVVYGMPYKAVLTGGVSKVLPLHEIPRTVCDLLSADPTE